jgi:hypothetical protein
MAGDDLNQDDDNLTGGGAATGDDKKATEREPGEVVGEAVEIEGEAAEGGDGEEPGEVVVTIGDEPPPAEEEDPARAPQWLKDLRKSNREKDRALRERDAEIARLKGSQQGQPATLVLGDKPTLASCEFDEAAFESKLEEWHTTKRKLDEQTRTHEETKRAQQAAWEKKLAAHDEAKKSLRVPDFDDAAAAVEDGFSVVQRGILIDCAQNSAALQYALGKNPAKLKELAAIQNPAHFTWALAQLETKLKIEPRRAAPPTERVIRGSGSLAGTTDKTLESLRAEADRTGDRTKVTQYLRDKKRQA